MKENGKILTMGILVFVLTCFMFYSLSFGAPPLTQSRQPLPMIKVLQEPIILNDAIIPSTSLYNRLLAAIDSVQKAFTPVKFQDCPSGWFGLEETYYGGYKSYLKGCANKSYSVQDQQNAGCLGSDTVDQCTDKLLRRCLSLYEQQKTGYTDPTQGDLKTKMAKGIEKSDRINKEARELSDALKMMKNLMP